MMEVPSSSSGHALEDRYETAKRFREKETALLNSTKDLVILLISRLDTVDRPMHPYLCYRLKEFDAHVLDDPTLKKQFRIVCGYILATHEDERELLMRSDIEGGAAMERDTTTGARLVPPLLDQERVDEILLENFEESVTSADVDRKKREIPYDSKSMRHALDASAPAVYQRIYDLGPCREEFMGKLTKYSARKSVATFIASICRNILFYLGLVGSEGRSILGRNDENDASISHVAIITKILRELNVPYVLEVVVTAGQIRRAVQVGGGSMALMVRHAEALWIEKRGSMVWGDGGLNVKHETSPYGREIGEVVAQDYFDIKMLENENAFGALVSFIYDHRYNAQQYIGAMRCLKMLIICNVSIATTTIEDALSLGIFSGRFRHWAFACGPLITERARQASSVTFRDLGAAAVQGAEGRGLLAARCLRCGLRLTNSAHEIEDYPNKVSCVPGRGWDKGGLFAYKSRTMPVQDFGSREEALVKEQLRRFLAKTDPVDDTLFQLKAVYCRKIADGFKSTPERAVFDEIRRIDGEIDSRNIISTSSTPRLAKPPFQHGWSLPPYLQLKSDIAFHRSL